MRIGAEVAVRVPLRVGPDQRTTGCEQHEGEEGGEGSEDEQHDPPRPPAGLSGRRRRGRRHRLGRELALGRVGCRFSGLKMPWRIMFTSQMMIAAPR